MTYMTIHTIIMIMYNPIEWDGCQQINYKPRLQVVFCHFFGIVFLHFGWRSNIGGSEVKEDVKDEDEVDQSCQDDQRLGYILFAVVENDGSILGEGGKEWNLLIMK